jgi:hypothetical protein
LIIQKYSKDSDEEATDKWRKNRIATKCKRKRANTPPNKTFLFS